MNDKEYKRLRQEYQNNEKQHVNNNKTFVILAIILIIIIFVGLILTGGPGRDWFPGAPFTH